VRHADAQVDRAAAVVAVVCILVRAHRQRGESLLRMAAAGELLLGHERRHAPVSFVRACQEGDWVRRVVQRRERERCATTTPSINHARACVNSYHPVVGVEEARAKTAAYFSRLTKQGRLEQVR